MRTDKILIKGGRVIDPASGFDEISDLLIENGKISKANAEGAAVLDASGKVVCPGFIDMHAHLREPGREDEETVETASMAASRGGYTTLISMPNTEPPADNASVILDIIQKSRAAGKVRVIPAGALSKGLNGAELSDMGELLKSGARAVTDDGKPVINSALMRKALEYSKMFGIPVISHCEDPAFSGGVMNEGKISTMLGLPGMPSCSEEIMAARDIMLARLTGGRVHIAHVSTSGCVELIRGAKLEGLNVTAEATPHHISLTEAEVLSFDTNFRMNPPLRTEADVSAVKEGLKDGAIDIIATDHAPHCAVEKEEEFEQSPPGVTGLETSLSVIMTCLVNPGVLTLPEALAKLTSAPAKILNVPLGSIALGAGADVCVFDPAGKWTVEADSFFSRSKNSAFIGRELDGIVETVIFRGKVVFKNGKFV